MGHEMIPARNIRIGAYVDLQGDRYADPDNDPHDMTAYEYAVVENVVAEAEDCVRVDTTLGSFGFPPEHPLRVLSLDND
jgi:hypothetical protein